MKKYMKPAIEVMAVQGEHSLLTVSPGVENGSNLGDEFYEGDVSYSRGSFDTSWGDE